MLAFEEAQLLAYLRQHPVTHAADVFRNCGPGVSGDWGQRLIANLEWLGYLSAFYDPSGAPDLLQLTEQGRRCFA